LHDQDSVGSSNFEFVEGSFDLQRLRNGIFDDLKAETVR
jgi:hypothetical protein